MHKVFILLFLEAALILTSCTQKTPKTDLSVDLIPTDSLTLNDGLSRIDGVIMAYHKIGDDQFILGDNKPGLYLFDKNEMIRRFGNIGQGPCEFTEISATDVDDDTLYILSSEQVKIIGFDISSGECVGEFSHKTMSGITHLLKEQDKSSFLALKGSLTGLESDSLTILYRLFEDESVESLELKYGRVNAVPSVINFRSPNLTFAPYKNTYYFYLPQTDSLYNYNPESDKLTSFAHGIDLNRNEIEKAGQDFQKMMDLLQKEVKMIGKVYASADWLAIEYIYENIAEDLGQEMSLYFYRHDGTFIAQIPAEDLIGFEDGKFIQLRETGNDPDFPFSMVSLKPQFN
ncbi:6-bladed beta-propeller [Balneola sp. MJW-20]|uniref:6-bladed beta-propeller n=1 Tax=Gracilimonas aurantiaca TaxID=3234185 RepID=UPI00346753B7